MVYTHICPISQNMMEHPVLADDNHLYECEMIKRWLATSKKSPVTNQLISDRLIDFAEVNSTPLEYLSDDELRDCVRDFREQDSYYQTPRSPINPPEVHLDLSAYQDDFNDHTASSSAEVDDTSEVVYVDFGNGVIGVMCVANYNALMRNEPPPFPTSPEAYSALMQSSPFDL